MAIRVALSIAGCLPLAFAAIIKMHFIHRQPFSYSFLSSASRLQPPLLLLPGLFTIPASVLPFPSPFFQLFTRYTVDERKDGIHVVRTRRGGSKGGRGKERRKLLSGVLSRKLPALLPIPLFLLLHRKGHFQFKFVFARQLRGAFHRVCVSSNDQRKAFMY